MRFIATVISFGLLSSPSVSEAQNTAASCGSYTVGSGDTLALISQRLFGSGNTAALYAANRAAIGDNPNSLTIGQRLTIPCLDQVGAAGPQPGEVSPLVESLPSRLASLTPSVAPETAERPPQTRQVVPIPSAMAPQTRPDTLNMPSGLRPQARTVALIETTEPLILTFNRTSHPEFVMNKWIVDPYLNMIELVTEGRVQFVDPEQVNHEIADQFQLVTSGAVDGAYVVNSTLAESHPLLQLPMIPLMGGSAEQTAVSLWNLHDTYLTQTDYFDDAHLLGFVGAPAAHIWHQLDEPVAAGQGILTQNSYPIPYFLGLDTVGPTQIQQLNETRFGSHDPATDDPLRFMMAHGPALGAGIWTETRGVTEVENGVYTPTYSMILSNEAWDRILPRDQEIITQVSGLALAHRSSAWDDFDNGHRSTMLETGLVAISADRDLLQEIEATAQDALALWSQEAEALGIPAQQAIDAYRADLMFLRYLQEFR